MKRWLLIVPLSLLLLEGVYAETPEEKGLAIVMESDRRDTGWQDQKASLRMVLRNRHGDESERKNHSRTLEVNNDGDKSLIIFDSPRDIKGTAFLSFTHSLKADDQWLYLPALKRVKRISSSNKSGPFMGSEFAYEDLASLEVDKFRYKYLKEDQHEGRDTFVVTFYPQYKHTGYKKQIVWIDKEHYQPLKVEFYDRKDSLLKTLTYNENKQYLNRYWRPGRMEMVNHQTGKSTSLYWTSYEFQTGLSDRDFDKNSLKRAR